MKFLKIKSYFTNLHFTYIEKQILKKMLVLIMYFYIHMTSRTTLQTVNTMYMHDNVLSEYINRVTSSQQYRIVDNKQVSLTTNSIPLESLVVEKPQANFRFKLMLL